jgi:hypothetical protein
MPSLVYMEMTRKSKDDLPPTRISESVIPFPAFWQTRIWIALMVIGRSFSCCRDHFCFEIVLPRSRFPHSYVTLSPSGRQTGV